MKRKQLITLIGIGSACLLIGLIVFFTLPEKNPDTIFSIPQSTTPAQLKAKGFTVNRDPGSDFTVCYLYSGTYLVTIHYANTDTTSILQEFIVIDYFKFEEMTGMEPTPYSSVVIDGATYRIVQSPEQHTLSLTRLGLQ